MIKRAFDCIAALTGLVVLLPLLLLLALGIWLTSGRPVLFGQRRVGRHFRPFTIYKFRTMYRGAEQGGLITWGGGHDPRITPIGRLLRATKLDELPQLLNVVKGDMSLVGPRPEVEHYVEMFKEDYRDILRVRPGITDPASLKFRDEAALMAGYADPRQAYVTRLLPEKIALAKEYVRNSSMRLDLTLILQTLLSLVRRGNPV